MLSKVCQYFERFTRYGLEKNVIYRNNIAKIHLEASTPSRLSNRNGCADRASKTPNSCISCHKTSRKWFWSKPIFWTDYNTFPLSQRICGKVTYERIKKSWHTRYNWEKLLCARVWFLLLSLRFACNRYGLMWRMR